MNVEPKPGIPPSAGHLSELVGRLKGGASRRDRAICLPGPEGGHLAAAMTGLPAVELPYTVGGTPGAKDLFGLFDDSIARLMAVKK